MSTGLNGMSAGLGDSRLMMPQQQPHVQQQQHHHQAQPQQSQAQQLPQQNVSWHQPSANYTHDTSVFGNRGSWDWSASSYWETTIPNAPQGHMQQRIPSISQSFPHLMTSQDYKDYQQRTTQA